MFKTRKRFHNKIAKLEEDVFVMAGKAKTMINASLDVFIAHDTARKDEVIAFDDIVDKYYRDIGSRCVGLLATQQPMAKDLRLIAGTLKVINDIERLGDYAVDIAKGVKYLNNPLSPYSSGIFNDMRKIIMEMLDDCLSALRQKDTSSLENIVAKDGFIDDNFGVICNYVVSRLMEQKTESRGQHEISPISARVFIISLPATWSSCINKTGGGISLTITADLL
jgi:phosphate transport system protein